MPGRPATLAILALPGPVRDGLVALFSAIPALIVAVESPDWAGALEALASAAPDVLVIDAASVPARLDDLLTELRANLPNSARLVLVDDAAQARHADHREVVVLKGAPAADLVAAVQSLLR
jgi:DNA-binding NarL/FixJ family response regulator